MKNQKAEESVLSLEEVLGQLDGIVENLSQADCSLEESLELYQQGMNLLKIGNDKIDRVEKQMMEIDKEGELHEFSGGTQ